MPSKVPLYHPQGVEVVQFYCLWAQGSLGMSPTEKLSRKCGLFFFSHFFEGIHKLQTRKMQTSAVFTLVTHGWQQNFFLDEFDAIRWDLDFQAK
jgi:hypothetical protein